jgi:4-coumarate--CoA ligase
MCARIITSPEHLDESQIPHTSIAQFLLNKLKQHSNKELLLDCESGRVWTANQISKEALNLAAVLIQKFNLKSGETVMFYFPNSGYYAISMLAVFIDGGIFTGIFYNSTYRELKNAVHDCDARYIICCNANYETALKVFNEENTVKNLFVIDEQMENKPENCDSLLDWIHYEKLGNDLILPVERKPSDMAAFLFTSGSTGKPKPATRTNLNLIFIANSLQHPDIFGHKPDDIVLSEEFFYISGLLIYLHCLNGGTKIAIRKAFDIESICNLIQKYKITSTYFVSTFVYLLAVEEIVKNYDISSLNDVISGGASIAPAKWRKIKENLPNMNLLRNIYGSNEIGLITQVRKYEVKNVRFPTIGKPLPGFEVKIVDISTEQLLEENKIGEIRVKSDQGFAGYYKLPELTAQSLDSEGFFKTGDAGYYDECDNLYIVGRYKEIIKVSGFVVSLVELENILCGYEPIKEVCVIGISDEIRGEVPKAFVVLKDGYKDIDENAIQSYVAERVNSVKHLWGGVVIVEELPKLSSGKFNTKHLKIF